MKYSKLYISLNKYIAVVVVVVVVPNVFFSGMLNTFIDHEMVVRLVT